MNQDAIWDHFQNEGVTAFSQALLKQSFAVESARAFNELDPMLGNAALPAFATKVLAPYYLRNASARSQYHAREDS